MGKRTEEMKVWSSSFGQDYTDRNPQSVDDMDALYLTNCGVSRSQMNEDFLSGLDRSVRILEVGCNVGSQLNILQNMGFENLYGIELQPYAVEMSKIVTKHINIIQGDAFDIPYKDGYFDLVYTSGVLIHINPADVLVAMREIYRTSSQYIWGYESYADTLTNVPYRGNSHLYWKTDFPSIYQAEFPTLKLVKNTQYKYKANDNIDCMFLLEK